MKRLIIITLLLLAATAVVTVAYFKNLSLPGTRSSQVINTIPSTAAFLFEFNNDDSFYSIYDSSALFASVIGKQNQDDLQTLKQNILDNTAFKSYFAGQNIYVSVHPQADAIPELLFTMASMEPIKADAFIKSGNPNLSVKQVTLSGKPGYLIHFNKIDKDFYLLQKNKNIYAGSFAKSLVMLDAAGSAKTPFKLLPDQQSANSLGNLYINYQQLTPYFNELIKQSNTDFIKALRMLPATAALSLNYKSDALMFSGYSSLTAYQAVSYLNLFSKFKPIVNHLKNIFPVTTAYSSTFAVDKPAQFTHALTNWQQLAHLDREKASLFAKIKSETGVRFDTEFNKLLGNEFAIITTRFDEKFAIVQLSNGSALRSYMTNISTMSDEETGQLNYDRIPFFLLGDIFSIFKRPHFLIIDNYLVLANSSRDLSNYKDNYLNARFLSKTSEYGDFDNLLSQKSSASFCVFFKNANTIFKRMLSRKAYQSYQQQPGFKSFYAASYQLSAADNEFYTNFCMKIDTSGAAGKR